MEKIKKGDIIEIWIKLKGNSIKKAVGKIQRIDKYNDMYLLENFKENWWYLAKKEDIFKKI